eukprot:1367610-Amphidinium_carterae.1
MRFTQYSSAAQALGTQLFVKNRNLFRIVSTGMEFKAVLDHCFNHSNCAMYRAGPLPPEGQPQQRTWFTTSQFANS